MVCFRPRGVTRKRGFRSKREAQDWLHENEVAVQGETWKPAASQRITLDEVAKSWLRSKTNLAPKTRAAYEGSLEHFRRFGLNGMRVGQITPATVEEWIAAASKERSPKSVRNSYNVLHAVMNRAVRDEIINQTPCIEIELPKVAHKEKRFLTAVQVEALAAAAGDRGDLVLVLAMTGMRWGELAGLQVQDVDLEHGYLLVGRQITELNGRLIHSLPKHGKRRRVGIMRKLRPILEAAIGGKSASDLVFTTPRGSALRVGNARRDWFDEAAAVAGVEGLTPHELRHTFASLAIKAGANPKALQASMGHSLITVTMDRLFS